jgi:DNA invertase Pin-like site-specific DNA recombinase
MSERSALVPAAQYVRVSTERQEYSLDFQFAEIAKYAQRHGFVISQTYCDEARSGLVIEKRAGLARLLRDVTTREHCYTAILVYDVSRWGRFQDPDEAAYYEFVCKGAGIPVHYCAEPFSNDGQMPNLILKALKRVMAGEYSRELSEKVFGGMIRLARSGFRAGAQPGYGYRRMLVASDGSHKAQLAPGEYKSISNERVILVLGPAFEVHCVQEIYRMFVSERKTLQGIADELNLQNAPFQDGRKWKSHAVRRILCNPKYKGTALYNRTTSKLMSVQKPRPESEWVVVPEAFAPIVSSRMFEAAQDVFRNRPWNLSNEQVLDTLRSILKTQGSLSSALINNVPGTLSKDGYRRRFGSLTKAFQLVGYDSPHKKTVESRHAIQELRQRLMEKLVEMFPGEVSILGRGSVRRNCLRLKNGAKVTVRACLSCNLITKGQTWIMQKAGRDKNLVALMAGMNEDNTSLETFYVVPRGWILNRHALNISDDSSWLKPCIRLPDLDSFCDVVHLMLRRRLSGHGRNVSRRKGWLSNEAKASIAASQRVRWATWRTSNSKLPGGNS